MHLNSAYYGATCLYNGCIRTVVAILSSAQLLCRIRSFGPTVPHQPRCGAQKCSKRLHPLPLAVPGCLLSASAVKTGSRLSLLSPLLSLWRGTQLKFFNLNFCQTAAKPLLPLARHRIICTMDRAAAAPMARQQHKMPVLPAPATDSADCLKGTADQPGRTL